MGEGGRGVWDGVAFTGFDVFEELVAVGRVAEYGAGVLLELFLVEGGDDRGGPGLEAGDILDDRRTAMEGSGAADGLRAAGVRIAAKAAAVEDDEASVCECAGCRGIPTGGDETFHTGALRANISDGDGVGVGTDYEEFD
jgi:hypothetical protein